MNSSSGSTPSPDAGLETFVDPVDGTVWEVDVDFLASNWTCIWDRGCEGILDHRAADLGQGCCSLGAELLDDDEARRIVALSATLGPSLWHRAGEEALDETERHTRVVGGACVFWNPRDFDGGAGCALHLGAVRDDESPTDWKPAVCWQLPLKVERPADGRAVLRRWQRADWGAGGATMAWCCTEEPEPLVGDQPVIDSLAEEIEALVGPEVAVAVRTRLRRAPGPGCSS